MTEPRTADGCPTIIVPLDGSIHATAALPVAQGLAELEQATIHLVHIGARALPPEELSRRLKVPPGQLSGKVLTQMGGEPAACIVRVARERRSLLIVMCPHTGIGGEPQGALGSVAREVLLTSSCPVVLVQPSRGDLPWKLSRILIPHDGTPTSAAAIRLGAEMARRAGAEIDVLHVAAAGAPPGERGSFSVLPYLDQPQHEWPSWSREFLDRLRAVSGITGAALQLFFARGETGLEIMELAARRRSDLIAIAWRGSLDSSHSEVLQALVRDAPSPVAVFRTGD